MSDEARPPGLGGKASTTEPRIGRAPEARILDADGSLTLLAADGSARVLRDEGADLGRAVLEELLIPKTREELRQAIGERAGEPVAPGGTVDLLVDLLFAVGAAIKVEAKVAPKAPAEPRAAFRIVLALTGAIGSANAPAMAARLCDAGYLVRVVMTREAARFVRKESLEALTHAEVHDSLWGGRPNDPVPHLELAAWADAVLICPASATTLSRLARGDFSDLVSAVALGTRAPVLIAPSMNPAMLAAPSVQRNLSQLRDDGFLVVLPGPGTEVADAPRSRVSRPGAAPHPNAVLDLLRFVLTSRGLAAQGDRDTLPEAPVPGPDGVLPPTAAAWEELYASGAASRLPWFTNEPDLDVVDAVLGGASPPRLLLDVGTGSGDTASGLAAKGYTVVATDVSATAIASASARHPGAHVVWVADDILSSKLAGRFDVIVDRGCLHVLVASQRATYVHRIERLLAPGGLFVLKVDAASDQRTARVTHRFDPEGLRVLFGDRLVAEALVATAFGGGAGAVPAWLAVYRRRGAP